MAKIVPFAAAWIGLADPQRRSCLTAISDGVDPMYVVAAVRCLVTDAHAGVVVSPDGQTWPMPDLTSHAALAADSQVIRVAPAG